MKIIKGNFIFCQTPFQFDVVENGYLIIENNKIISLNKKIDTKKYSKDKYQWIDYQDKLIIPGLVDLHVHAPQFANKGLGLDKQLLEWLNTYTFPEEAKFKNLKYAKKIYQDFITSLWENGTTRSSIFSTIHLESTKLLFDLVVESGLSAFIGKVNMDINSPKFLIEKTKKSLNETEKFIQYCQKQNSELVKPIITPRFVPTCSKELLQGLGLLAKKYNIPIQSHLSENNGEIKWVKELFPNSKNYASVYNHFQLLGQQPTIMAHCVHSHENEIKLLLHNNIFIAHCPWSNWDLTSGLAPIAKYLHKNVQIGLGTDIAGGHTSSIMDNMVAALTVSKIENYQNENNKPLTLSEVFYFATKGGGKFFGKVGSFEANYEFDALVIDDKNIIEKKLTLFERIQKFIYTGNTENIKFRYVAGKLINKPKWEK